MSRSSVKVADERLTQIAEKFIQLSIERGASRNAPCREATMNLSRTCRILGAATLLAGLAAAPAVQAGQATGTLSVSASVAASCSVNSPTLGFGAYDATNGSSTTATVTVTCTAASGTVPVALGNGSNWNGTTRRLSDGASTPHYLTYGLYSDSNHATAWDNTSNTVAQDPGGKSLTVYGLVPSGQSLYAGSYTDSVSITVTF
jgi:spore coat protein U-like protein